MKIALSKKLLPHLNPTSKLISEVFLRQGHRDQNKNSLVLLWPSAMKFQAREYHEISVSHCFSTSIFSKQSRISERGFFHLAVFAQLWFKWLNLPPTLQLHSKGRIHRIGTLNLSDSFLLCWLYCFTHAVSYSIHVHDLFLLINIWNCVEYFSFCCCFWTCKQLSRFIRTGRGSTTTWIFLISFYSVHSLYIASSEIQNSLWDFQTFRFFQTFLKHGDELVNETFQTGIKFFWGEGGGSL